MSNSKFDLFYSIKQHRVEWVRAFLRENKGQVNLRDAWGQTPMYRGVKTGNAAIVRALIISGADFTERTETGLSLLHQAAKSNDPKVLEVLLQCGLEPNDLDLNRETPLHYAARYQTRKCVKLLLSKGANPNLRDLQDRTPLHLAAQGCDVKIVKLLVEHKADVDATADYDRVSPLFYAVKNQEPRMVKALLELEADVHVLDFAFKNALHHAVKEENLEIVSLLIEHGAWVNGENTFDRRTPLHVAVQYGQRYIAELLFSYSAKVNALDVNGRTALHLAAVSSNVDLVHVLVNRGADINIRAYNLQTPLKLSIDSATDNTNVIYTIMQYIILKEKQGLPVNPDDLMFINNSMARFKTDCLTELAKMQEELLHANCKLTAFEFITIDYMKAVEALWEDEMRNELKNTKWLMKWPIYSSVVDYRIDISDITWRK